MFFQSRPSHYHGHHPSSSQAGWSSRLRELDEREQSLLGARERLVRWAEELQAREDLMEEKKAELGERKRALRKQEAELKKRVMVLNAADRVHAQASKMALETAAATVLQRAARCKLAQKEASSIVAGFRALRGLEKRYLAAVAEYDAGGNQSLLDHEITKILEAADGISTSKSKELRAQRKSFVKKVMRAAGDEGVGSETSSDTGSEASYRQDQDEGSESWVAVHEMDVDHSHHGPM